MCVIFMKLLQIPICNQRIGYIHGAVGGRKWMVKIEEPFMDISTFSTYLDSG